MQKTLKHNAKADFLLDKGMDILWSKGYNATSVSDIVKAAEVPKGSFYFYFDSKEDFAVKAIEKYFIVMFTPAKEILEDKSYSPRERLLNFHEYRNGILKVEMGCTKGCMACNIGNEMAEHSEKIRNTIDNNQQYVLSLISSVIEEAKATGEIKNPMKSEDIAAFIEDAGKGAMISMKETKSSYPVDNVMNFIKMVLLN